MRELEVRKVNEGRDVEEQMEQSMNVQSRLSG